MTLFDSFTFHKKSIKNRIMLSPFSDNQSERNGKISHQMFESLIRSAKQGVGSIIFDSAYICQQGRGFPLQLGISEEEHLPGLKNIVRVLKEDGIFVGIRLSHAGAKTNRKLCGEQPIGPSAVQLHKDCDSCREFDEHDIKEVCTFFAHSAERATEAGFDFVEINCAQELLLTQCLNAQINQREDEYGGSMKNRMRLLTEVIESIKKTVPASLLISVYFDTPFDWAEPDVAKEELKEMLACLEKAKIDLLHPAFNSSTNKISDSEILVSDVVNSLSALPKIVEGNIKSTTALKEVLKSSLGTFYCLDKAIFQRQNWFQFLRNKIA